jgi:hypothetical protein
MLKANTGHHHFQHGIFSRSEGESIFQDAFTTCCTRLRAQIAVEDDPATNRECCVQWEMLVGKNRSLAQLECCAADRASDLQWFLSFDSEASRFDDWMIGEFKARKIAHGSCPQMHERVPHVPFPRQGHQLLLFELRRWVSCGRQRRVHHQRVVEAFHHAPGAPSTSSPSLPPRSWSCCRHYLTACIHIRRAHPTARSSSRHTRRQGRVRGEGGGGRGRMMSRCCYHPPAPLSARRATHAHRRGARVRGRP